MADGDEHTVGGELLSYARFHVLQPNAGNAHGTRGTQNLIDGMVPNHLDLRVSKEALLQYLLGAELGLAMHDGDLGREVGQEQRFFHGGIAAANDDDLFAAIEEAVAGGAGRHAETLELAFAI